MPRGVAFRMAAILFPALVTTACSLAGAPRAVGSCADASTKPLTVTKLFFGMTTRDGRTVSEQDWQRFVEESVTPRFPGGFTVFEARGEYLTRDGVRAVESARVILRVHAGTPEDHRMVSALADEYRRRFDQESVLRLDSQECGRF